MKKILVVAGTRPNFIKISLFKKAAENYPGMEVRIVHTGQHYDENLSGIFFRELQIKPDYFLTLEEKEPEDQITEIERKLTELVTTIFTPDLLILVGDVNSTRAAAEVAMALKIPAAHVESGLRSFDNSMPEEHNRIIADKASSIHFTTEPSGNKNLLSEGFDPSAIFFSGNTMIDTLVQFDHLIAKDGIMEKLNLSGKKFALVTIHRPSNVDSEELLQRSINLLKLISEKTIVVFPVHPRTGSQLKKFHLYSALTDIKNILLTEPLGYFAFQKLITECQYIITDSGGIQEEATFRKKPCITIRPNTERPVTIETGTNTLVNWDMNKIISLISDIEGGTYKKGGIPELWDGKSTERIFQFLSESL